MATFPTMIVNYNEWYADDGYCARMCSRALDLPVDAVVARNPATKKLEVLAVNDEVFETCHEIVSELARTIQEELTKQ